MKGTKLRLLGEWRPLISQNPGRKNPVQHTHPDRGHITRWQQCRSRHWLGPTVPYLPLAEVDTLCSILAPQFTL